MIIKNKALIELSEELREKQSKYIYNVYTKRAAEQLGYIVIGYPPNEYDKTLYSALKSFKRMERESETLERIPESLFSATKAFIDVFSKALTNLKGLN
jgi:hypothetical protein|tara:strand:+ start:2310 stop:2603 length:294 start_codon:yes stop_codon:yes gene_type:complete